MNLRKRPQAHTLKLLVPLCLLLAVWHFASRGPDATPPSRTRPASARLQSPPPETAAPDFQPSPPDSPPGPAGDATWQLVATKVQADARALASAGENLPPDFLNRIVDGKTVSFKLPDGSTAEGSVAMIDRDAHGVLFVQGRLTKPAPGSYFLQRQTAAGLAGPFVGNVRFDGKPEGWKLEPTPDLKAARFTARALDEIVCANYSQLPAEAAEGDIEYVPQNHPTNIPNPPYQTIIPLQSLPGATGVIYLDFDGETGPFAGWGEFDAAPATANNTQVFDVWKMVCEDFQGFNLNITTDRKVFDNAPAGRRQQVIISPTTDAAPGAGGVAYIGSYNWADSRPCWAFYSTGKSSVEVISHEIGHTLGLSHDGRTTPAEEYYGGHGSGSVGWAPIMGVGYSKPLTQWSKGEYLSANRTQDDLAIIVGNNNDVDYRADDTGDSLATAQYLEIASNNAVSGEGIIEQTGDVDAFRFVTSGGTTTLNVNTVTSGPNLDLYAEIVNASTLAVLVSNNPDAGLNASLSANLAAGEYLLRVRGTGRGDPLGDGYTNYGCLGSYLISGSVTGGTKPDRFSIAENPATGTAVGSVAARNSHGANPLTWAIASGNTGGAFAINAATGAITAANSAAVNYEALSLRWDDPSTFELFVTITDATNPALNESIRTVVTVTDLNEAPTMSGTSLSVLEHTLAGSLLATMNAADPDRFQYPLYSITGGNTGNVFAMDSATGRLTVAADINVTANTVYSLSVTATDQGTPALATTATVTITVINIADGYVPGRIVRTYFDNIGSGNSVANLTGNAKFPNTPDSEQYLTAFDGLAHGDNFGSTIRGYLIPPATGTYQFWIASDDASELRLGTNATPASATVIATVAGWTEPYAWTANASQQSVTRSLTAGQPYYIEARHKEGGGGDHVAVAWTGPGITTRQVIPGAYLAPFYQNYAPKVVAATFSVRDNAVPGQPVGVVTSGDVNAQDSFSYVITGGNPGGVFAINAASGQLSVAQPGLLNATSTPGYTLTIMSTDNGTPALNGTGTVTVTVLAATGINETGIVQEIWTGISGTAVSNLTANANYPYKPALRRTLTSFDSGADYADNYGSRIRVKFVPPTTDSYKFYVASDDASSLLFSANASGGGAAQIAYVSGWTTHNNWTANASQTSAAKALVAGQAVYLETQQKEGGGGDHISVAYTNTTVTTPTAIPGSMLLPFDINAAPVFSPASYAYSVTAATATAGQVLGTVTATERNGEPLIYAILSGNAQGAFAINSDTGQLTVANPAGLSNGAATLQVAAQDGGLGAVYPLASATATVVVNVTAGNTAPAWVSNPIVKPGAAEAVAYSQTLADSATDVDPGDTLTFSKISGPAWLAVAANGDLTGTPGVGFDGLNSFVVRVTDASGIFTNATLNITVTGINHPPVFTVNPMTAAAMYGVPVTGAITATDANAGDTLTYSKLTGPAWLGIAANGTLTGTAASTDLGVNAFSVRVTDAAGATADGTLNVTVSEPTLYFDMNGSVAGSGAPATATWSGASNIWSGSSAGTGAGLAWVSGALGVFSAGTDAGTTTITVSGTHTLRGLTVEEGTPTLTGGTLALSGTTPTLTIGSGRSATISSALTGTTGMRRDGDGSLTLGGTASNTYTGATTFASNGHLILSKTGGAVAIPGDLLMAAPGTRGIVSTSVDNQFAAGSVLRFTSTGDTRLELKGTTQTLGGIENTGVTGVYHCVQHSEFGTPAAVDATSQLILNVAGTNAFTFNTAAGSLRDYTGGVLSLVKSGTGTQTLSGGNVSYTGTTAVNAGKLVFAGTYGSPTLSIASGATLELSVASGTIDYATSTLSGAGTLLKTGAGTARWGTQAGTFALGAGSLIDVRTGIFNAGSNSNENWSGNLSSLNVSSGATVTELTYSPAVFDALTGAGSVQGTGTSTLTIGANNTAAGTYNTTAGAATFSGVISSVSSLIKTGTGTQTLGGANTYTGTTTVNQGSLLVTGSLGNSAVTVAAAGTLGGTGTLAGTVTHNGTLAPGTTGPGTLTINKPLTLAPGSKVAWQVANWTGTAGTGYDKIKVSSLNLTATSADPVTVQISEQALTNFTEAAKTFTLLESTAAITGFDPAKFTISLAGFTTGHGTWAIQQSGNNLVLAYTRANTTPEFGTDPILKSATQGLAISGSISATDPDLGETLTYAKEDGPAWLAVSSTGVLSGTPANADIGLTPATVRVTDSFNATTTATLNITVANINDPPAFTADPITANATEDSAFTGQLSASDIDPGDTAIFSKISGPVWLDVAANGSLSGTPLNANVGLNSFAVRVTDGGGLYHDATLTITVANTNDAPVFTADPIIESASEDAAFTGQLAASDVDTVDTLTYAKVSGPLWLTVSSTGALSGTPTNDNVGTNTFIVSVTDNTATVQATLNITVINTNDSPAFAADPIIESATEDAAFTGQLAASDVDTVDTLTYAKVSGPLWLTVSSTGALSGTPTNDNVGTNTFVVSVTDNTATVQAALNITVINTNDSPAFAADPIIESASEDAAFTGQLAASDVDTVDTLTYAKVSGPLWLTVSSTGALSGTPTNDNVGTNTFVVSVTDNTATVQAALNITVINTNDSPAFAADPIIESATEDAAFTGQLAASDVDTVDTLTYAKVSGPLWLTVSSTGALSGTPTNDNVGTNTFVVSVTDGTATATAALHITVAANNPDANGNGILDVWEIAKFGNANPGAHPAAADPDGDGLANLMEYALDTAPLVANRSTVLHDIEPLDGAKYLRLTVDRNPVATNLSYTVETCDALNNWSSTQTVVESDPAHPNRLIVRDNPPAPNSPRRFIRLRVSAGP